MANNYIDLPEEGGSGSGVSSLNDLSGALTLVPGAGITITPDGSTIMITSTSSGGTVTAVGLADSTGLFNITGSPVTSAGTLTLSSLKSQSANTFFAAPNGSAGAPTFRLIVPADIPILNQNTTGTAANITATSNSTLTTLSALSLPGSQVTGSISGTASNITATSNSTLTTLPSLTLPGSQVSGNIAGTASNITATSNSTLTTLSALSLPGSQVSGNIAGDASNITATSNSTLSSLPTLSLPFAQVTGVVPISQGGTGQTTATTAIDALLPTQTGVSGYLLSTNGTSPQWVPYPSGVGTVTSVSVASTNGFAGSVANPTSTPAITLSTTVTGILYGNGTSVAAAISSNFPTLNQSTTGTASNVTGTTNSTLTTLSALSITGSQVTGNISGTAANITASSNSTLTSLSSLTSAPSLAIVGSQVGGFTQGSVIFAGASGMLTQDNANFYWNDSTFNLGLGVIPATTVTIDTVNTTGASKAIQTTSYGVGSAIPFRGRFARGTLVSPAAAQSGDNLSTLSGRGYGTSQFATASTGAINIVAGETFTNTSNATYLQFEVTPTTSVTIAEAMRLNSTGNLMINTTTDTGQKLQVNGTAIFSGAVTDTVAPIFSSLTGFLFGNGASAVTALSTATARSNLGIDSGLQLVTTGTTYTTPAAITTATQFKFTIVGGGGGGASTNSLAGGGAGGGGGGALVLSINGLSPSTAYTIAIGAGGTGSTSTGGAGGSTTLTIGATTYTASGGSGAGNATTSDGGAGGTGTNGTINITGANGDAASGVATAQSGGGGASGFGLGLGGNGVIGGTANGNSGTGYGGGGGGAKGNGAPTSGSGSQGAILVEYYN